jgi:primosomal protein N' (replication factor Y)
MKQARKFARVIVPAPVKEPLVYSIPEGLETGIAPGSRVLIPLQRRTVTGIVLDLGSENPPVEAKPILELLDDRPIIDHRLLKLAQWISHYYLSPMGEVLATMLPSNSRRQSRQMILLKRADAPVGDELGREIVRAIEQAKGKIGFGTLARRFPGRSIHRALTRLESLGIIEQREHLAKARRQREAPPLRESGSELGAGQTVEMTAEQASAVDAITRRVKAGGFETFLLHGVTGSGKTEVYLQAMEAARDLGRKSLILIPEISLTPQLLDQLYARFPRRVGVLHSALTAAQRWSQWREIAWGQVDVAVGARSAVFAPLPDLGLIVVDEEHDSSYKQEEGVRYHGRDVAVVRGKQQNCPVILGSATPALESYENCRQGRYTLLEMGRRVADRPLPKIEAIDLRRQFFSAPAEARADNANGSRDAGGLIAADFAKALQENIQAGRQSLIFLNRRGFANFLQCTSCGHVVRCPHCSVTLTFHLKQNRLSCHHCDYRRPKTEICPECSNPALGPIGSGTERIEQALRRLLPQARVARMDRDTTGRRGSHEEIIRRWQKGEIDVLVGTQMITKGHDVSGVTLVGALLADLSLNLPDFRAAERTFQLLSQVAGRAGRGNDTGRVIVQTYTPDHYAIEHLLAHDYKNFFAVESEFRRALEYPPFGRLVNLRLDGAKAATVESQARRLAEELRKIEQRDSKPGARVEILGPAPAPIEKLRNRFRWQILLRSKQSAPLLSLARQARELLPRTRSVRLHVDVDPHSML